MGRWHLFEIEDQAWCPAWLRDAGTGYLRLATEVSGQAAAMVAPLREVLALSGEKEVLDLCSGSGGPLIAIATALREAGDDVRIRLSDRFPNVGAFEALRERTDGAVDFVAEPVDAMDVPPDLPGLRVLVNGFHHFRPEDAAAILRAAVDDTRPIAVFELLRRNAMSILAILFAPIAVMLLMPGVRPFRFSNLLFTYLIPLIPLFVLWDGLVSCLRIYDEGELRSVIESVEGSERYDWHYADFSLGVPGAFGSYLLGVPRRADGAPAGSEEA